MNCSLHEDPYSVLIYLYIYIYMCMHYMAARLSQWYLPVVRVQVSRGGSLDNMTGLWHSRVK